MLLVMAIGSAAWVGLSMYRMLWPLASADFQERTQIIGGRTRSALEREKTLVLRAIKELEFDQAMGKVSDADFKRTKTLLRTQALGLMKQLDAKLPAYADQIEKELAARLKIDLDDLAPFRDTGQPQTPADEQTGDARVALLVCASCQTENDADARFCKSCGDGLEAHS